MYVWHAHAHAHAWQAVLTQLRGDFDVRATRRAISIERFWELMGGHVDKLERHASVYVKCRVLGGRGVLVGCSLADGGTHQAAVAAIVVPRSQPL